MKILYFSPVEWTWIKQRPHFLAEHFSFAGNDVVFCSRVPWGKGVFRSKKRRISERLIAHTYAVLPFALRCKIIEKLNNFYLKNKLFKEHFDIVIIADPRLVDIIPDKKRCAAKVIYECMDRHAFFYQGKKRETIQKKEQAICNRADAIVTSSVFLKNELIQSYNVAAEKITVIRNAAADNLIENLPENENASGMLYAGTIDSWFDWNSVISFAHKNPSVPVRIAGPLKCVPANLPSNIELCGVVPHSEIAKLLQSAELLVIPFVPDGLIQAVDPVKLYEYLASGRKVLSSYWQELDYFKNHPQLNFYHNEEEFVALAEKLLADTTRCAPDGGFLAENCWSKRSREFLKITGVKP